MKATIAYSQSQLGEICHVFVWRHGEFYRHAIGINREDALSTMIRGIDTLKDKHDTITLTDAKRAVLSLEV